MNRAQSVGAVSLLVMMSASVFAPAAEHPDGAAAPEPQATALGTGGAGEPSKDMVTGLIFETDVAGKITVRDGDGRVLRLEKELGERAAVPLLAGEYEITCERRSERLKATVQLNEGERKIVERADLRPLGWSAFGLRERNARPDRPCRSGWGVQEPRAWRLSLDSGFWRARGEGEWSSVAEDDVFRIDHGGLLGGVSVGYRLTPEWMVGLSVANRLIEVSDEEDQGYDLSHVSTITTFSLGARYYLPPLAARSGLKPYVSAGIGPSLGIDVESHERWDDRHDHEHSHVRTAAVFGGQVGAGVDLQMARWLVLGSDVTYHLAPKFSESFGGRRDPSGFTFSFQLGVTFGCRLSPAPAR